MTIHIEKLELAADTHKPTLLAVCLDANKATLCTYRPTDADHPENMWRNLAVLLHLTLEDAGKSAFHDAMKGAASRLGLEVDYFELDPRVRLITNDHVHVVLEVEGDVHNKLTLLPAEVGEMMEKAPWIDGYSGKPLSRTIHAERRGIDA